jgi:hypothetical protein
MRWAGPQAFYAKQRVLQAGKPCFGKTPTAGPSSLQKKKRRNAALF